MQEFFKNCFYMLFLVLSFSSCEQEKKDPNHRDQENNNTMRTTNYPINDLILHRWSARAMSGEPISHEHLMSLFEAARWAPSSYNNQPWRFIYVTKEDENWQKMFSLLVPFNQSWAKNASALILVISSKNYSHNNQPAATHSFDTGAAVQNLALQGNVMGLVVHTMEGFDFEQARKEFGIPEEYSIEAMVAVGKPASKNVLPQELQEKETPSQRKEIREFISQGVFGNWNGSKK
jgi:nitroreductase